MIEIFRHNNKWRIKIVNETLEFDDGNKFEVALHRLVKIKETFEPNKYNRNGGR